MYDNKLASPCGLYCGVCNIHYATKNNDQALKEKIAKAYGQTPDKINCDGCRSNQKFLFCQVCGIRSCTDEKGFEGCFQCNDFPCAKIESFPVAEGKKNILRAVPRWRELGTEQWIKEEENLFSCKNCGKVLFRGAKKCRSCSSILE